MVVVILDCEDKNSCIDITIGKTTKISVIEIRNHESNNKFQILNYIAVESETKALT